MADDAPIVEVRRVVIEHTVTGPPWQKAPAAPSLPSVEELAEAVRRELIRTGYRNPDIFGGRA